MSEPDGLANQPRDVFAAVTHADPISFYQQLRVKRPLYWDDALKLWIASSAQAVLAAFAKSALRVRPPLEPVPRALVGSAAGEVFANLVRMNDGVFHARHKPDVKAVVVAAKLRQIRQIAAELALELPQRFPANDLLAELPLRVMASALGVANAALDDAASQARAFVRGIAAGASAGEMAEASIAASALVAYWQRRGCNAIEAAHRIGLMQQSLDATAGLLGNTILLLQRQPHLAASGLRSQDAARRLVAEVARWDAPIQNTRRFASAPLKLLTQPIGEGECVLLILAGANRDAALNTRPDQFDANRKNCQSLTFGAGEHACPAKSTAIEIVAKCARVYCVNSQYDSYFKHLGTYAPLPNARVPVFAT